MRFARCLLFGALSLGTHGQEGEEPLEDDALTAEQLHTLHAKMDGDGDGRVSLAETMGFSEVVRRAIAGRDIAGVMTELDADGDGHLNLEEVLKDMEAWGDGDAEQAKEAEERRNLERAKFRLADVNGDGRLDKEELPAVFYPETHSGVLELVTAVTLKQKDLDGDGRLTEKEFWEGDAVDGESLAVTEEEQADFRRLDQNGDGLLDVEELKAWESGFFHTEFAMKKLFEVTDRDGDMHVTAAELATAREQLAGSDAQYHLMEWAEHFEL